MCFLISYSISFVLFTLFRFIIIMMSIFFLALSLSVSLFLDVNLASNISLSSDIIYVLIFFVCSGDVSTTHANSFISSFEY